MRSNATLVTWFLGFWHRCLTLAVAGHGPRRRPGRGLERAGQDRTSSPSASASSRTRPSTRARPPTPTPRRSTSCSPTPRSSASRPTGPSSSPPPTPPRTPIVKAIEAAVAETGKDDLIILAFFGRGSSVAEKPCFFTPESSFKDRAKTALTTTDLEPAFKKIKGQKLLLMMDVSYKGHRRRQGEGRSSRPSPTSSSSSSATTTATTTPCPPTACSCFGNLPFRDALTKGDHGLFYSVLADGLGGKADEKPYNTGYESDGLVTIKELAKYLEKEIPNGARRGRQDGQGEGTDPVRDRPGTSRFWVTRNAGARRRRSTKRLKKLEALEKDGKLSEEDAKEGAGLLFRMPKLNWPQELRKEYQKLADGKITPEALLATRKTLKEGLKLPKEDAETFATKVTAWVSELSGRYIKPVTPGELTAAAIRGLYTRAEEPLPADIEDALKSAKDLTANAASNCSPKPACGSASAKTSTATRPLTSR